MAEYALPTFIGTLVEKITGVDKALKNKIIIKVIYIPGKILNIVVK